MRQFLFLGFSMPAIEITKSKDVSFTSCSSSPP